MTSPRDDRYEWITVKEYASIYRVHERTVWRWIQRQCVVAERHGPRGGWRIKVVAPRAVSA